MSNFLSQLSSGFGIASGVAGLIGDLTGWSARKQDALMRRQAALQYDYSQRAADAQQQRNIELWNMNNEYNTPSAQRSRLEQAGLLGASLFSGQSPVAATQVQSQTAFPGSSSIPSSEQLAPGISLANRGISMARELAEIDNIKADTSKKQEETLSEQLNQSLISSQTSLNETISRLNVSKEVGQRLSNDMSRIQNAIASATKETNIDLVKQNLTNARQSFENMAVELDNMLVSRTLTGKQIESLGVSMAHQYMDIYLMDFKARAIEKGLEVSDAEISHLYSLSRYLISSTNSIDELLAPDEKGLSFYDYMRLSNRRDYNWKPFNNITTGVGKILGPILGAWLGRKGMAGSSGFEDIITDGDGTITSTRTRKRR